MKKNLIIIGTAVLLLAVGLSGCNEIGLGITNIGDIDANPENYLGKEVTVEGDCSHYQISDDSGHTIRFKYHHSIDGMYRLTGIIEHVDDYWGGQYYHLNVTKVKAI
jgi:hypothetical protein